MFAMLIDLCYSSEVKTSDQSLTETKGVTMRKVKRKRKSYYASMILI